MSKIGTVDAILQLIDDCTSELDRKTTKYIQLTCLDFSKAFDKLQPSILLGKLVHCGVNSNIVNLLDNFFETQAAVC